MENNHLASPVHAESGWSSKDLLLKFIQNNFQPVKDTKGQSTKFVLTRTGAIESLKGRDRPSHVISVISGVGSTQTQSAELLKMGFTFPFPKPVALIKYLVSMIDDSNCLILDSFAGSGTTGHAVLRQNAEDGGDRRFILVEMDEGIARSVTAERLKRVSQGHTDSRGDTVEGLGGGFQYCKLSNEPLFTSQGQIRADVTFAKLAEFVWFAETGSGYSGIGNSSLLGVSEGRAIYLLYNGILKDKSANGGNVLTGTVYDSLPDFDGPKVIYAAASRLGSARLLRERVVFKQTPYALEV